MVKAFTQSDQFLVELLRESDKEVFNFLYDKYWDKLYNIAFNRLRDRFEAEEVVQDIYTRLWRNKEKLMIETEFSRYLSGAVKLEIINRLAKRARILERAGQVAQRMYLVNDYDIHDQLDLQYLLNDVDQTIQALPEKCRIVFMMSRKEHLSHSAIAERLQISEKTVQKHITFALKNLREKYANLFYLLLFLFFEK